MPRPNVRIRMYRPGLGDCFLLSFLYDGKASHILVDCGVFTGTKGEKTLMEKIANDIGKETGNRLHALVATHEHWDHVAGFIHAKEVFKALKVEQVWLAWTEDPSQTIVQEHKRQMAALVKTIGMAVKKLADSASPFDRECGLAIAEVLGFEGLSGESLAAAKFSVNTDAAMDFVNSVRENTGTPYLSPGDIVERPWLEGVRVYVLGPPKDLRALRRTQGSGEEMYESRHAAVASGWMAAVMAAATPGNFSEQEVETASRMRPFDASLAWPEQEVPELSRRFGSLYESYEANPWRKIDHDWLLAAGQLALQLDNATNNTSLVLAFELVESGEVLLFVGDAQVGNWISWIDSEFTVPDGRASRKLRARDLLARTVFYKVGHHGSGNATLRAGLEAMPHSGLVAAIPTDEDFAKKKGWEMPAPKLLAALEEKTKGRILRADMNHQPNPKSKPARLSPREWEQFCQAVTVTDLYVDYHI